MFRIEWLPPLTFALGVALVALLWRSTAVAPALLAEAELVTAELRSVGGGVLVEWAAEPGAEVRAGEVLGRVRATPPAVLAASLAVLRAELDELRAGREPEIAGRRLAIDADRLRLEWMRERVTLAAQRVELQQAESELARQEALRARDATPEQIRENARLRRDELRETLAVQEALVAALAPGANPAEAPARSPAPRGGAGGAGDADGALAAALRGAEAELRLAEAQLSPEPILAPFDGVVTALWRRAGEVVLPGEAVAVLAEPETRRVVGFLRQPLGVEPRPGMTVELRSRRPDRITAEAKVAEVGRVLEPVPPTLLALLDRADSPELGLRVYFDLPRGLALRPGEIVEVMLDGAAGEALLP